MSNIINIRSLNGSFYQLPPSPPKENQHQVVQLANRVFDGCDREFKETLDRFSVQELLDYLSPEEFSKTLQWSNDLGLGLDEAHDEWLSKGALLDYARKESKVRLSVGVVAFIEEWASLNEEKIKDKLGDLIGEDLVSLMSIIELKDLKKVRDLPAPHLIECVKRHVTVHFLSLANMAFLDNVYSDYLEVAVASGNKTAIPRDVARILRLVSTAWENREQFSPVEPFFIKDLFNEWRDHILSKTSEDPQFLNQVFNDLKGINNELVSTFLNQFNSPIRTREFNLALGGIKNLSPTPRVKKFIEENFLKISIFNQAPCREVEKFNDEELIYLAELIKLVMSVSTNGREVENVFRPMHQIAMKRFFDTINFKTFGGRLSPEVIHDAINMKLKIEDPAHVAAFFNLLNEAYSQQNIFTSVRGRGSFIFDQLVDESQIILCQVYMKGKDFYLSFYEELEKESVEASENLRKSVRNTLNNVWGCIVQEKPVVIENISSLNDILFPNGFYPINRELLGEFASLEEYVSPRNVEEVVRPTEITKPNPYQEPAVASSSGINRSIIRDSEVKEIKKRNVILVTEGDISGLLSFFVNNRTESEENLSALVLENYRDQPELLMAFVKLIQEGKADELSPYLEVLSNARELLVNEQIWLEVDEILQCENSNEEKLRRVVQYFKEGEVGVLEDILELLEDKLEEVEHFQPYRELLEQAHKTLTGSKRKRENEVVEEVVTKKIKREEIGSSLIMKPLERFFKKLNEGVLARVNHDLGLLQSVIDNLRNSTNKSSAKGRDLDEDYVPTLEKIIEDAPLLKKSDSLFSESVIQSSKEKIVSFIDREENALEEIIVDTYSERPFDLQRLVDRLSSNFLKEGEEILKYYLFYIARANKKSLNKAVELVLLKIQQVEKTFQENVSLLFLQNPDELSRILESLESEEVPLELESLQLFQTQLKSIHQQLGTLRKRSRDGEERNFSGELVELVNDFKEKLIRIIFDSVEYDYTILERIYMSLQETDAIEILLPYKSLLAHACKQLGKRSE